MRDQGTAPQTYRLVQIVLHWAIAVMIVLAFTGGDGMGRVLNQRISEGWTGTQGNTPHVWIGGIVFLLILLRIVVRLRYGAPPPVQGTPPIMVTAAKLGHLLLYALMIAVPVAGATAWYGQIRAAGEAHEILANALMLVAIGHALAAIGHEIHKPGSMLVRMFSARKG